MKLAYLLNSYPRTSTTFIRREIEALERAGIGVDRYAARQWEEALVDPLDIAEKTRTRYLLTGNIIGLLLGFVRAVFTNPARLLRAFWQLFQLWRNAKGGMVRHCAYLLQAIYFQQCAAREKLDHVHVHFSTNATAVAMLAHTLGGPGYSFTVHGPDELLEPKLSSLAMKIKQARFVVAITDFCRSQLIWHGGNGYADKVHVMRCGLDLSGLEAGEPADPGNQTLLCIGRLCPQKGQVMLPRVASRLRGDFPALKIILVGDGEARADIEAEIAKYGVGDIFDLRGWMENTRTREILQQSRALLLPSAAEGLPIVIMEALALGKPVLSTYIAGIPELLDETCGWIIPAGSETALERAMGACLRAPPGELAMLGEEGRKRVALHHNIDDLAQSLIRRFQGQ